MMMPIGQAVCPITVDCNDTELAVRAQPKPVKNGAR
jgi:hypothetical protein